MACDDIAQSCATLARNRIGFHAISCVIDPKQRSRSRGTVYALGVDGL
jgi:hypothetical protein